MAKPEDGLGALIVATPAKDGGDDEMMGDEKTLAAEALIKAMGRKDAQGVADAFKQMFKLCDDEYEDDEPIELDD
jgi:hypothetical protein